MGFDRKYESILHLPHHVSRKRQQMSRHDRAAQFAPFAALTGYEEVIRETARLTDRQIEFTDTAKAQLDGQLQQLHAALGQLPEITVTYFLPDERKAGGEYITHTGKAAKLDTIHQYLLLADGTAIPFAAISRLEGDLFSPKETTE